MHLRSLRHLLDRARQVNRSGGENVAGIIELALEQVCLDLEREGYEVQPVIIPACAVDAPHRRDRVWIIAHRNDSRSGAPASGDRSENRTADGEERKHSFDGACGQSGDVANATSQREERAEPIGNRPRESKKETGDRDRNAPNARSNESRGLSGGSGEENPSARIEDLYAQDTIGERSGGGMEGGRQVLGSRRTQVESARSSWENDWTQVATEFCGVDDGLSVELDGFKLSKAKHRNDQLKAYGNAIVPQVAMEIMQGIRAVDW